MENNEININWKELANKIDNIAYGIFVKMYNEEQLKGFREYFPVIQTKAELESLLNKNL